MSWWSSRNDDDDDNDRRQEEERQEEARREDERREEERQEQGRQVYVSADGRVHSTPQAAIDASLAFEESSNTGAGCNQDSENVR